ncbi:unnamed protein product [Arctia plantaginis]|uniref:Uncharacterized protein n=1 Tax=Arctia plantaginis TaxID=874455 RepID=A0A8S1AEA4_ARCPL|nr:unnamed protein product [Arctia plantaginis]
MLVSKTHGMQSECIRLSIVAGAAASGATAGGAGAGGAVRRASERDLPARLAAEPVKSSKSTPALHHVASPPPHLPPHQHHRHPLPTSAAVSTTVASGSPNAWPSKSRSSHNLSAPSQHDGFYQNLSSVQSQQHALQDRWSSLRSSTGSNRPQSAHFAAGQAEPPDSPLHHQHSNAMSARAAKLAEMSEEVSRRQQVYQMHPKMPLTDLHQHMMGQPPLHLQQAQPQHLQQTQPQHLQQAQPQHLQQSQQQHLQQNQQQQHLQQSQQQHMQQSQPQHYQQQSPQLQHTLQHSASPMSPMLQHMHPQQQIYHNQHMPQRYEWLPPGPPSPQRSQPPVAPKPQGTRRIDVDSEDQQQHSHPQPQQPSAGSIQPEDERYVASALEPPAVSVYPAGGAGGAASGAGGAAPHNPWQREERERQAEARRAAARARRDAAIAQLVSLGASRTPVQNQQLRSLQLERDFELRAQHDQEENNAAEGSEDMEEDMEDSAHSVVSAASPPPQSPAPLAHVAQPHPHPPKSILKTNTRTEITNGYSSETQVTYEESRVSDVSAGMGALSVGPVGGAVGPAGPGAPAPPARGSSFAVMAERARTLSPHRAPDAHVQHGIAPQSPVSTLRDKRVSFHERAAPPAPPAPPSSSPPPLHEPPPPREDPDRFIEEAENMLAGPLTPPAPSTSSPLTHTPGVIGAQEVYRDPRTRRLAEQQARAPSAPVPEQLSFKEKMKMFALESGEASTPKDKGGPI